MIADVLTWWSRQILELVPARFARPDPSAVGALLVEPYTRGDGIRLVRRQAGEETALGDVPLRRTRFGDSGDTDVPTAPPDGMLDADDDAGLRAALSAAGANEPGSMVLLRLPAGAALQRDVTLPLAAEAGLDRVLAYEMDRLTPFAAEVIFFAWTVLRRDREAGRMQVRLSLVPKAPLLPLLETLRIAGAAPRAIEIFGSTGGSARPLRIPLAHERPASARQARRLLMMAGGVCAVLAVLAIALPFILQSMTARALDRQVAGLQPRVEMVQALRRRIAGSTAGGELVGAERRRLGDALHVMEAVTRVLPDDSYLSDLTLRQGVLTISGQSPGAAKLIPAISSDPAFSAPAFAAPVTRIEGQNTDLFSIRAGVTH